MKLNIWSFRYGTKMKQINEKDIVCSYPVDEEYEIITSKKGFKPKAAEVRNNDLLKKLIENENESALYVFVRRRKGKNLIQGSACKETSDRIEMLLERNNLCDSVKKLYSMLTEYRNSVKTEILRHVEKEKNKKIKKNNSIAPQIMYRTKENEICVDEKPTKIHMIEKDRLDNNVCVFLSEYDWLFKDKFKKTPSAYLVYRNICIQVSTHKEKNTLEYMVSTYSDPTTFGYRTISSFIDRVDAYFNDQKQKDKQ